MSRKIGEKIEKAYRLLQQAHLAVYGGALTEGLEGLHTAISELEHARRKLETTLSRIKQVN